MNIRKLRGIVCSVCVFYRTLRQNPRFYSRIQTAPTREYSTYRVVTTSRIKVPRHLVVHDNLKRSQNMYSECSVQNLLLPQLSVLCALGHCTI